MWSRLQLECGERGKAARVIGSRWVDLGVFGEFTQGFWVRAQSNIIIYQVNKPSELLLPQFLPE